MSTHFVMFGASITAIAEAVTTATSHKDGIHAALEGLATNNTSQRAGSALFTPPCSSSPTKQEPVRYASLYDALLGSFQQRP